MDDNQGRGYALLNSSKWRLRYNRRYVPKASSSKSTAPNGRHVESVSHRLTGSLSEEDEDEDSYLSRGHANDTPDRRPLTMPRSQKPTSPAAMTQSVGSSMFLDQPPVDRYNGVYIGLLLAGVGFLLPYNSFVSAVDYFQDRYQGSTIIFDMSFVYILVAFIAVLINNALVESVSLSMRINFGYLISLGTLTVVTICEVAWESFPTSLGYLLNLVGVAIVAFGCTIQQSSFYGYTSMLPARYTQAVMAGESAAGLIVSANRIVTKLLISDERANTLMFFSLSIFIILICVVIHNLLERTDFIQYYVRMCNNSSSMSTTTLTSLVGGASSISSEMTPDLRTRRPETRVKMDDSDFGLVELNGESDYLVRYASASRIHHGDSLGLTRSLGDHIGLLARSEKTVAFDSRLVRGASASQNVRHSDSTEFDMPFGIDDDDLDSYQPPLVSGSTGRSIDSLHHAMDSVGRLDSTESTDPDDIFGLERATRVDSGTAKVDLVTRMVNAKESVKIRVKRNVNSAWQRMTYRLGTRMQAISLTWPYMVAIATAYLVTLSLFPGIETEILSCRLGTWMPVLLMAVFNLTDFIGKIAASFFYTMSPLTLVTMAAARIVFVPLLSLAVAPRADPILHHEAWSFVLTIGLGLTNGVFGSLPMILAPLHVPSDLKELTGNLMTLSYSLGLTAGSALAYLIDWLLGPSLNRKFIEHLCDHMAHLSSAILTNSTSGFLYNNQTIL